MKVLWLGWRDYYASQQMRRAAERTKAPDGSRIEVDLLEILDVAFEAPSAVPLRGPDGTDLLAAYDVLVVRLLTPPYLSEALSIARHFADAGKVVIDQALVDEGYAISKMHDYVLLGRAGVDVPRTHQVYGEDAARRIAAQLGYPCILKGVHGAHGTHVFRVADENDLARRWRRYLAGELVVQEYVDAPLDYRVLVIGYQALPLYVAKVPPKDDFRSNAALGAAFEARPLDDRPALRDLAERAARALRREFAAVDIRGEGERPLVLEVNRRPDFEEFEKATGYDVAARFLRYAAERHAARG